MRGALICILAASSFQLPASSFQPHASALLDGVDQFTRMFGVKNEKKPGAGCWKLEAVSVIAFLSSGCADADNRVIGPTFFAPP